MYRERTSWIEIHDEQFMKKPMPRKKPWPRGAKNIYVLFLQKIKSNIHIIFG